MAGARSEVDGTGVGRGVSCAPRAAGLPRTHRPPAQPRSEPFRRAWTGEERHTPAELRGGAVLRGVRVPRVHAAVAAAAAGPGPSHTPLSALLRVGPPPPLRGVGLERGHVAGRGPGLAAGAVCLHLRLRSLLGFPIYPDGAPGQSGFSTCAVQHPRTPTHRYAVGTPPQGRHGNIVCRRTPDLSPPAHSAD